VEEVASATVAGDTAVTGTVAEDTAVTRTVAEVMATVSTLVVEATAAELMGVDTAMDMAAVATMGAVTMDVAIMGAVTTAVATGVVRYSGLDSDMRHTRRAVTTHTGIQLHATFIHLTLTEQAMATAYSYRSASTGSIRVARRAGSHTANRATAARISGTVANVAGSQVLTP
jgi:hypothetical protein